MHPGGGLVRAAAGSRATDGGAGSGISAAGRRPAGGRQDRGMVTTQQTYSTKEALSALADRGHDTTARVLRNVEKQLGLDIGRSGAETDEGQRVYTAAD